MTTIISVEKIVRFLKSVDDKSSLKKIATTTRLHHYCVKDSVRFLQDLDIVNVNEEKGTFFVTLK